MKKIAPACVFAGGALLLAAGPWFDPRVGVGECMVIDGVVACVVAYVWSLIRSLVRLGLRL
jgi:hypothetical protein